MRLDLARIQEKPGGYGFARSNGLNDATLLAIATEYRKGVSRRYIQLAARDLPERFAGDKSLAVSTKYDGEGVFIYYNAEDDGPRVFAFNAPSGRVRIGLKCLHAFEKRAKAAGISRGLFVGELYLQTPEDGPRATVADVIRLSFNAGDGLDELALAMFDIIMIDGADWRNEDAFQKNWDQLSTLFGDDPATQCHRVEGGLIPEKEVPAAFENRIQAGHEGIVIRRLDKTEIFKAKPSLTIDAVIIGYVEDEVETVYGVTSILLGLTAQDGVIQEFVRAGSGFTDAERVQLLQLLSSRKVDSPITKTDSDGRPVSFVRPELIVELNGETLERENLSGRENLTPVYAVERDNYTYKGLRTIPRMTHATFSRFREDKAVADGGARLTQVLGSDGASISFEEARETDPEIVRRSVYTKETKGALAVRKFILVETEGGTRAPYVIVYTDISLGRKQPIQHSQSIANTREHADQLFEGLIAANIKKGWEQTVVE